MNSAARFAITQLSGLSRRQEFLRQAFDAFAECFPRRDSAWLLNEYSEAVHRQDHYKIFAGARPARPKEVACHR